MLASLLIVFREIFEAGLVIGIVLAATEGVAGRGRHILGGVAAGVLGALAVAVFAGAISNALDGYGQELFNASILAVAVVMLGWHNVWMAAHGREMAAQMRALGRSVALGKRSLLALGTVVAVAVLREGAEVVLFLFSIQATDGGGGVALATGGLVGVGLGGVTSWLLYRGLVVIPPRHLFKVTSIMIAFLAAGMAGQVAAILVGIDLAPALVDQLWDSSSILSEASLTGRALHTLIGYADRPSGLQLLAYVAVLGVVLGAGRWTARRPASATTRTVAAE